MSSETKARINLFAPFMQIFASGIDVERIDENEFNDEQRKSQAKADELMKGSAEPLNVTGGNNRSNRAKLNKTYKAEVKDVSSNKEMSPENLEKMIKTLGKDKEIGDNL